MSKEKQHTSDENDHKSKAKQFDRDEKKLKHAEKLKPDESQLRPPEKQSKTDEKKIKPDEKKIQPGEKQFTPDGKPLKSEEKSEILYEPVKKVSTYSRVLVGGIAGIMVTTFVHPLDLVKIRMQLYPAKISTISMARNIVRCEGFPALYNGVMAGVMRQATYTTTRLGVYYWLYESYVTNYGMIPGIGDKLRIGLCAGLAGALAGNPSEVALVRMMADGRKDPCCVTTRPKKTYNGLLHALYKISTTEGVRALWRGGTLTLLRSASVSIVQIGSYVETREFYIAKQWVPKTESAKLHICTSVVAGFLTAVLTLPVDTLKTMYQVRTDALTQKELFLNHLSVDGITFFWRGFFPYFSRLTTHTILTYFILQEVGDIYASLREFLKIAR